MTLSANTLTELRKVIPALNTVCEFEFPGGTERISEVGQPIGSATLGSYAPRIRSVTALDYGLANYRGGVTGITVRVTVDDHDLRFRGLNQRYGRSLNGCRARLRWASPNLTPAAAWDTPDDWITLFTGVFDGMEQVSTGVLSLILRTDDLPLQRPLNLPTVTPYNTTTTTASAQGKALPVVYGMHDSRALSGTTEGTTGALPCVYLGNIPGIGYCYSPSAGSMFHIDRCFVNGVFTSSANWTRSDQYFPGALATVIAFSADQGAAAITCDGYGLHPGATGAINLSDPEPYINAVKILRHILANWCYRGWRTDSTWYGDSVLPIDVASWDAASAYLSRQRSRSGIRLTGSETGAGLIASMCRKEGLRAEWTRTGLALRVLESSPADIYQTGAAWIAVPAGDPGDISSKAPVREDVDAIVSEYWRLGSTGARSKLTVVRPGCSTVRSIDTNDSPWGDHRRFMDRGMLKASVTMSVSASWLGLDLGSPEMKDGATVHYWRDVTDGFRTAHDLADVGIYGPTLKTGVVNARPVVRFDGVDDYLVGALGSSLMSVTEGTIVVVFRASAITTNGTYPYQNHGLVCSSGAYWGLYLRTSGGHYYLQADSYDAGLGAHRVAEVEISLDTWYVARYRHFGGTLYLSIDNWTEASIAAGSIGSLGDVLSVGRSYAGAPVYFQGDIAEISCFSSGDLAVQGAVAGFPGGGANYDMFRTISDEYGIN